MKKKNLLVAAGLVLLATACKEDYPVIPVRAETEITSPKPELIIPLDVPGNESDSKGKPVRLKPEAPNSSYRSDVIPKLIEE